MRSRSMASSSSEIATTTKSKRLIMSRTKAATPCAISFTLSSSVKSAVSAALEPHSVQYTHAGT